MRASTATASTAPTSTTWTLVADTYDYNDHALRRLNERVKNALDPAGILAPGKSGIWPPAYAAERGNA